MAKRILLTGGCGYIGSHTAVALLESGWDVVIVDNLSNSDKSVKGRIEAITGKKVKFVKGDSTSRKTMEKVFKKYAPIYAVIHFAGYKAVGESVTKPLEYYTNNLESAIETINAAINHNVMNFIFSSSATVYGDDNISPFKEDAKLSSLHPYGETKLMIEKILSDISKANPKFRSVLLRYFNPVGAHESGLIGENPNGRPNNLMPYMTRVATGKLDVLTVFGSDYDTKDGTCIRDFIHVMDIAEGHVAALERIETLPENPCAINLGRGEGVSVKELLDTFNKITGGKCKAVYGERRKGDIAVSYASAEKAKLLLSWSAKRTVYDMCESAYNFEKIHSHQ